MFYRKSQSLILTLVFLICFYKKVNSFINFYSKHEPTTSNCGNDTNEPLYLTPLIKANQLEKARQLSKVNFNEISRLVTSFTGFLTVNETMESNLFFWYFVAKENPKNASVLLWLQGGPGVTAMYGVFNENGPFFISANGVLEERKSSWHNHYHMIYIDNPVGTGFSFTKHSDGYAENQIDIGNNLYEAIKQFFTLFSELQLNEFYIVGESYGGKFASSLAYKIYKDNEHDKPLINLSGLAIGNGFTDPINQIDYSAFLYQISLIGNTTKKILSEFESSMKAYIKNKEYKSALLMAELIDQYIKEVTGLKNPINFINPNKYKKCNEIIEYLKSCSVRNAINVGDVSFSANSQIVIKYLVNDISQSVAPWTSELLSRYSIYFYSGQLDILVAPVLVANVLSKLKFNEVEIFNDKSRQIWHMGTEVAGYYRQAGNLTEIIVRNAGHLAPIDQPECVLDILMRLTTKKGF